MSKIAFTALAEASLRTLLPQLENQGFELVEVQEVRARETLAEIAHAADVYLIGENVAYPIPLTQLAQSQSSFLSILIINDHTAHLKQKKDLLFTPFIGNSVQSLSNADSDAIIKAVVEAARRTRQRKSYLQMKSIAVHLKSIPYYEEVKLEYLDKFLEEAPIGAILMTEHGIILDVNKQATLMLDVAEQQLVGASFASLLPQSEQQKLEQLFRGASSASAAAEPATFIVERFNRGSSRFLDIRLSQIATKAHVPYRLCIVNDVTDNLLAKLQIEEQVEALKDANNQLKRANADLDAFVYTASHDLKAPMANIEGLIDLLQRRVYHNDPTIDSLFSMVKGSIERFQETIKDLTEVTLVQKRSEDEQDVFDACDMIGEVQNMIREMIIGANAQVVSDCMPNTNMHFSRSNFRSIVFNLLSNAIKYRSPDRNPIVHISLQVRQPYFLLTVKDNGLGIPADKQEKMFSMFKRFHSHVEGTGIGLFIVKRIIDTTDSKIEVESKEGHGTSIRVYLRQK